MHAARTYVGVLTRYLRGLGISALCTAIAYPLYPYFDPVNIVMLYLLGATVAGLRLGRGPAALTAIVNTATFDFFFVPPRYSFYVSETQYLFTLSVMLGVAFVIANLMANGQRQTEAASRRERRTAVLYALSRELAGAADATTIANISARHVAASLEGLALVLLPDEQGKLTVQGRSDPDGSPVDAAAARSVFDDGREEVLELTRQPPRKPLFLRLACAEHALGVLMIQSGDGEPLPQEQRALLSALIGQIALALERAHLAELAAASRAAAERAALRTTLLASISHDLRGPLSAIAGAGSLVAQSSGSLDRHRRKTLGHLIEEKARDMSELLTNVLELMRLETGTGALRADWQSLEDLAGVAVRNIEHRFGGRRMITDIPNEFPPVFVDGQLAVQLFTNLLENATKHTPADTSIAIRAAVRDGRAVLTIEDDGPGFGARDPEELFEKFERGQKESHVSGVGLGLAICRAIVHLHGGEIRASNRDTGGGARFEFTLPLESAATIETAEEALVTRAMHRVLVVEDDPAIRKIVSMLFETNGFRVVTADTCELGVRQAQTYRPDVCIVDLGLPDKDGINFIRKVRDWSPVAILVLTARVAELQRLSAFEAGADDYIIKPFSSPEVLARVRAIMRRMARSDEPGAVLRLGDALIDFGKRVTRGPRNEEVHLTPLEHRILECLARHADSVVTHTQVMKEVWGPHQIDIRALRVYVASLRRKLESDPARPKYIVTEPGVGYRLVTESEVETARPAARNRLEKSL